MKIMIVNTVSHYKSLPIKHIYLSGIDNGILASPHDVGLKMDACTSINVS